MFGQDHENSQLVFVRNVGSGQTRWPGKVYKVQLVMYTVELEDSRVVRKHSDHLRARTCSSPHGTDATDGFGVGDDDDTDTPATADAEVVPTEPGPTTPGHPDELPSNLSEAPPTESDTPNVAGPQEAELLDCYYFVSPLVVTIFGHTHCAFAQQATGFICSLCVVCNLTQ